MDPLCVPSRLKLSIISPFRRMNYRAQFEACLARPETAVGPGTHARTSPTALLARAGPLRRRRCLLDGVTSASIPSRDWTSESWSPSSKTPQGRPVVAQDDRQMTSPGWFTPLARCSTTPSLAVDFNLGCPAPVVYRKGAGGGLLRGARRSDRRHPARLAGGGCHSAERENPHRV